MRYYGGYYGMYFDPTYWLVIIGAILCIVAQMRVSSTFRKYSRVRSRSGLTGAEAAQRILQLSGIYDVRIEHIRGELTDHYDPRAKVLRLSDATYGSTSVAAIGVAAHECGHALQHHKGYTPLSIRTALVPAANIGSKLGIPIIILGALLGMNQIFIQIGIWVFALAVLFQIVTLPVEFNASGRALTMLGSYGLMENDETRGCRKVLGAAALTYVAAAASAILQLLRLILLFGNNSRRND
ncbi:MAG: zinc metallopeptidase [Roseburia sp.]|nr:zinc metallopeptidase [Ruminococcus sp.]MCM1154446.1 zinc metallopeptidase [Roseburia sp.]MCM1243841.1 zinc metallopeptidase [Roseburia sp.]